MLHRVVIGPFSVDRDTLRTTLRRERLADAWPISLCELSLEEPPCVSGGQMVVAQAR